MTEKVKWNTKSDIILKYKTLEKNQGLKIYYKTADYDNTGDEIIVSQIIPSECTLFYSKDIPIQEHGVMKNFNTGIQTIGWDIYNKRFEINVDAITDIEIIDYAVDEIIKEFNLGDIDLTEKKRFKPVFSGRYNDVFIGIKDNKDDELLMTLDTIDKLNELYDENQQYKNRINELELLNDGLNHALKNIKQIDVEIDLND